MRLTFGQSNVSISAIWQFLETSLKDILCTPFFFCLFFFFVCFFILLPETPMMGRAFTDVLESEDMGHTLEMAERWIWYNFVLWELSGTESPSQHLTISEFLRKRAIASIFLSHWYFAFFCCLQVLLIPMCRISLKSENRILLGIYTFQERLTFVPVRTYLPPANTGLPPVLTLLLSWWTLSGELDASSCVPAGTA